MLGGAVRGAVRGPGGNSEGEPLARGSEEGRKLNERRRWRNDTTLRFSCACIFYVVCTIHIACMLMNLPTFYVYEIILINS